jgi:hypothetical protein
MHTSVEPIYIHKSVFDLIHNNEIRIERVHITIHTTERLYKV